MNASDQRKVGHIHKLEDAINQLSTIEYDSYDVNLSSLSQSGNNQWSGKHHDDFSKKYEKANGAFGGIADLIEDMIQEYESKISNIGWSIEDVPTKLFYGLLY
jgi:hypothetical protein